MWMSVFNLIGIKVKWKYDSCFLKVFKIFTQSRLKFPVALKQCYINHKLHYLTRKAFYFHWKGTLYCIVHSEKNSVSILACSQWIPWLRPPFANKRAATVSISSFGIMAFHSLWACLLIVSFFVSLAEASSLSDLFPPLWKESPGQFSDYSMENGKYIINPWVYPERLGMYKILLNQTASYFEKFSPENEQNILWGLPLQHGWQYTTGKNNTCFQSSDLPI